MDPNAALFIVRQLVQEQQENGFVGQELAEAVKALDDWLTGGGFPPDDWNPAPF